MAANESQENFKFDLMFLRLFSVSYPCPLENLSLQILDW